VRRALLSVFVGFAGAAAVAGSGWALQAAALPPPTSAARVAANASKWFHDYRLVLATFHFRHRRTSGACLRGWYGHAHGRKRRASVLALESGGILPKALAKEAGCSRQLASALAEAAQAGAHMSVSRGYAANQPAIALKVSRGSEKRLDLYVSPRSDRPLVAIVAIADREATARLYLSRVKRPLLAHFDLLRFADPRRL
jgi:hypothetical protein